MLLKQVGKCSIQWLGRGQRWLGELSMKHNEVLSEGRTRFTSASLPGQQEIIPPPRHTPDLVFQLFRSDRFLFFSICGNVEVSSREKLWFYLSCKPALGGHSSCGDAASLRCCRTCASRCTHTELLWENPNCVCGGGQMVNLSHSLRHFMSTRVA